MSTTRSRVLAGLALLAALAGIYFLGYSTLDFVQHLDRQVHAVHCSFNPAMTAATVQSEAAGCRAAMFSPYSSMFRSHIWGGVPVSLFGLGTYAFFAAFALALLVARKMDRTAASFMAFASLLPLGASAYFGYLSATKVGALCKLCAGTYIASVVLVVAAWTLRASVRKEDAAGAAGAGAGPVDAAASGMGPPLPTRDVNPMRVGLWAFELLVFLCLPAMLYASQVPDYTQYVTRCKGLSKPDDPRGVLLHVPTGPNPTVAATMVLDPLCPSCKALDERLRASGTIDELNLRAVVFPLDSACNWMLSEPVHPGACVVARALLCAKDQTASVLAYAYAHQDQLTKDPQQIFTVYPDLKDCADSDATKRRLDANLRFAIDNKLPVMTPQLYLGDHAVCDEDTDLGLDYALAHLGVPPP